MPKKEEKEHYARVYLGRTIHRLVRASRVTIYGDWDYYDATACGKSEYLQELTADNLATHKPCVKCFAGREFDPEKVPVGENATTFDITNEGIIHYGDFFNSAYCGASYEEADDYLLKVLAETGYSVQECRRCIYRIAQMKQTELQRALRRLTYV